jgi:hypothetical protein
VQSGGGGTRTTSSVQCGPQAEPARARLEGAIAKQASLGGGGSVQVPSRRSSLITFFRRGEMIAIKEKRGALRFCGARRGPAGLLVERSEAIPSGWLARTSSCGLRRGQPRQRPGHPPPTESGRHRVRARASQHRHMRCTATARRHARGSAIVLRRRTRLPPLAPIPQQQRSIGLSCISY